MYFIAFVMIGSFQALPTRTLQRQNLPITGDGYLESCTDMLLVGNHLYIAENRISRLQKLELGEDSARFVRVLATKGDGPGELHLPMELFETSDGGVGLRDNRGYVSFDREDRFSRRTVLGPGRIGCASIGDEVYHMWFRSDSEDLIHVFDREGSRVRSFFPKYLAETGVKDRYHRAEAYFYSGKLLDDGRLLYYVAGTQGKLVAMKPNGEIVRERSILGDFGPLGTLVREGFERYRDDPSLMNNPKGYTPYYLFRDAYLAGGKIYLGQWLTYSELPQSDRRAVHVYDIDTLEPIERIAFPSRRGEWVMSFVVDEQGNIVLAMNTLEDDDYQLVRLVP